MREKLFGKLASKTKVQGELGSVILTNRWSEVRVPFSWQ